METLTFTDNNNNYYWNFKSWKNESHACLLYHKVKAPLS